MQIVNTPIEFQSCFTASVTAPALTDYKFLSANNTFELNVQSMDCFLNPSVNPYIFPAHKEEFVDDLIRSGNVVEVIGNDIFVRQSPLALSATTFSTYFSAISTIPAHAETQQIKGFTSNHGQRMYLNLNTGDVYDVKSPSWVSVACSTLSALEPLSSPPTITNSTMSLSGGYRTLTTGQTFVVPGGQYHSVEFVALSGEFAINNAFRISTNNSNGQRSKSYSSTVANNNNMYLPSLTVSAISGGLVQWDGLYP